MAREKSAGFALDFGDLKVAGGLSGGDDPFAARCDGKGARRGFSGELSDGLEASGFGRNTKAGNAVVAAIGDVKETAVWSDFQVRASVGRVKICRKSGQALLMADLACVAVKAKDAHAAALFVVEIKAVQLRVELEVSGAGFSAGADERRIRRRQTPAFCVEGKNINRIGAGVGNISPLIVVVNQNCVGFCGGGTPVNRFGEERALAVDLVDSDFPSAVVGRKQKGFGAIQSNVSGIRSCRNDGEELEFACFGIHFVAGNLPRGSISGKESGAAAVGRKESGLCLSRDLPGQDKRPRILFLTVDLNLFFSGKRDVNDVVSLVRFMNLGGAIQSKGERGNKSPQDRFDRTRRNGATSEKQPKGGGDRTNGKEFHAINFRCRQTLWTMFLGKAIQENCACELTRRDLRLLLIADQLNTRLFEPLE